MPMINGIPIPYGDSLNANYGLLGGSPTGGTPFAPPNYGYPSGMGASFPAPRDGAARGSPLHDAIAALRAASVTGGGLGLPSGGRRMPPQMPFPEMIQLGGGQPPMPPMGAGGKPPPPLFWGENAAFPETGDKMSDWLHQLMGNAGGFFGGGGGSQFPNWTGGGNTDLSSLSGGKSGQGMFNF